MIRQWEHVRQEASSWWLLHEEILESTDSTLTGELLGEIIRLRFLTTFFLSFSHKLLASSHTTPFALEGEMANLCLLWNMWCQASFSICCSCYIKGYLNTLRKANCPLLYAWVHRCLWLVSVSLIVRGSHSTHPVELCSHTLLASAL